MSSISGGRHVDRCSPLHWTRTWSSGTNHRNLSRHLWLLLRGIPGTRVQISLLQGTTNRLGLHHWRNLGSLPNLSRRRQEIYPNDNKFRLPSTRVRLDLCPIPCPICIQSVLVFFCFRHLFQQLDNKFQENAILCRKLYTESQTRTQNRTCRRTLGDVIPYSQFSILNY
jgi:hypothetical protein